MTIASRLFSSLGRKSDVGNHCNLILKRLRCFTSISGTAEMGSNVLGSEIYIWGQLRGSSLGLGDAEKDESTPARLPDIDGSGYKDISCGANHTAVVTGKGDLYTFGSSSSGELGLGEEMAPKAKFMSSQGTLKTTPHKVDGISDVEKVACGGRHTAAITTDGRVYTWGWGGSMFATGGLGHGDKVSINRPKMVSALQSEHIVDVSCGEKHTLVLTQNGQAYAFGEGDHGRIGNGLTTNAKTPQLLEYFNNIPLVRIVAAKEFSFALSTDGIPYGWGRNDRNQMGQGGGLAMDIYSCDPTPGVVDLAGVTDIALSQGDVLAVDYEGTVWSWGDRVYLEPNAINEERFQDDQPSDKIVHIAVASSFMCFVSQSGELFTCGKKLGFQSDVFPLGCGAVEPFKNARRVDALRNRQVLKLSACDLRVGAIVN